MPGPQEAVTPIETRRSRAPLVLAVPVAALAGVLICAAYLVETKPRPEQPGPRPDYVTVNLALKIVPPEGVSLGGASSNEQPYAVVEPLQPFEPGKVMGPPEPVYPGESRIVEPLNLATLEVSEPLPGDTGGASAAPLRAEFQVDVLPGRNVLLLLVDDRCGAFLSVEVPPDGRVEPEAIEVHPDRSLHCCNVEYRLHAPADAGRGGTPHLQRLQVTYATSIGGTPVVVYEDPCFPKKGNRAGLAFADTVDLLTGRYVVHVDAGASYEGIARFEVMEDGTVTPSPVDVRLSPRAAK